MPSSSPIRQLLWPLLRSVHHAYSWRAESVGTWSNANGRYWIPRFVFHRHGEKPEYKLGLFAGIHGDEPAGVHALCDFIQTLEDTPAHGEGYELHVYPLVNPTGFEDRTRHARCGKDLNREFWQNSPEPEVQLIEREILRERFHGFIALHSDDTSHGMYGFARGATMTEHLLKPALAAVETALPVNTNAVIDGFHAVQGIIRDVYGGILCAPPGTTPQPFEIILETPSDAPMHLQREAFVLGLMEILTHYRRLMAFGGDL